MLTVNSRRKLKHFNVMILAKKTIETHDIKIKIAIFKDGQDNCVCWGEENHFLITRKLLKLHTTQSIFMKIPMEIKSISNFLVFFFLF